MKIVKYLLLVIVFCMMLSSCNSVPNDVSSEHCSYARKAIEIVDEYLDYIITAEEAYKKISELRDREDTLPDTEFEDPTHCKDFSIEVKVSSIDYNFFTLKYHPSADEQSKLLENRNDLAGLIGEKKK